MLRGDARRLPLRDKVVQCVVTSPPYYGLRDYGVAGQIGLESRPDCLGWATGTRCETCYVCVLVAVFREVHRVLKPDGVAWLNLGDSYATGGGSVGTKPGGGKQGEAWRMRGLMTPPNRMPLPGLKPKDLIFIPHRVALALQADGWWVRNDIVWSKPNPMPHPATDRVVCSHEYVFLLAKSQRYYFNHLAIRNPPTPSFLKEIEEGYDGQATKAYEANGVQNPSAVKARIIANRRDKQRGHSRRHAGLNDRWDKMTVKEQTANGSNARSVWHIAPANYKGAHFATMPSQLARRCILAGSRVGDVVFDPFGGSGTTAAEAMRLNRRGIALELNASYIGLARDRVSSTPIELPLEQECL